MVDKKRNIFDSNNQSLLSARGAKQDIENTLALEPYHQ